ncbi:TonB-dependent receptor [Sphingobium cupriresistens]|uniref:TonB-dependent receptor n=2 Tax=Sphingobium cupriresistens TaxID=1132417 RepID=A0A8G1ZHY5_9SPHN|nr:TonB-dependent receptor [Sphingobium cupriresistens]
MGWYRLCALTAGFCLSSAAHAQMTTQNAIASASDAFGLSIGNEKIGLYGIDDVRGFSPVDAGNARIEGLYFAQVDRLPNRIVDGNKVRVGLTAQGYPFPAPTGIVDYQLTLPGSADKFSLGLERGQFGSLVISVDGQKALTDNFELHVGLASRRQNRHEGGNYDSFIRAGSLAWRPYSGALIAGFLSSTRTYDDEAAPSIFPGGDYLPPKIRRRDMIGQSWTDRDVGHRTYGALTKLPVGPWWLEAGLFRDERLGYANFTDVYAQMRPDGTTPNRVIVADANNRDRTTSGEVRLIRTFDHGNFAHRLTLSLRAKTGDRRFGGAQRISLGESSLTFADQRPEPVFVYGRDDQDTTSQTTIGLGYAVAQARRFSLDLALSKSRYRKSFDFAAIVDPHAVVEDDPMTGSLTAAVHMTRRLTLYGGHVRGFEEVPAAPAIAVNRGAVPPAIRTRQSEIGLRYAFSPTLNIVAGAFSITKPYFNLDSSSFFRALGASSNKGLEVSLAGSIRPGLTLIAGTVLIDSKISGDAVANGTIGARPIGSVRRRTILNLDWRLDNGSSPLSLDASVESLSARVGNARNSLFAPPRETIDLGLRYRFAIERAKMLVRVQVARAVSTHSGSYPHDLK